MIKSLTDASVLASGVKMPWFGLGVWQSKEGEEVENAVKYALKAGYRHIDTAAIYENEEGVGKGIKDSGVPREEIFLTTKLWNSEQGYESTLAAFEESRRKLGVEYVDLYLIHWPNKEKRYLDSWKALEKLYKDGLVKAIGVSNFKVHHLQDILKVCEIKPMVNQVEYHPHLQQKDLHAYCREHGIQLQAWSPLMQGKAFEEPLLIELGEKYGRTPAQIVLRWDLQNEVVTIPKSVKESRIIENANVFDFELSEEDMERISALDKAGRIGPDPDHITF